MAVLIALDERLEARELILRLCMLVYPQEQTPKQNKHFNWKEIQFIY